MSSSLYSSSWRNASLCHPVFYLNLRPQKLTIYSIHSQHKKNIPPSSSSLHMSSSEKSPLIHHSHHHQQTTTKTESNLNHDDEQSDVQYDSSALSSVSMATANNNNNINNNNNRDNNNISAEDVVDPTAFNPDLSTTEIAIFFCLGLAPVLAWNCIFVSEAYFYSHLGEAVLSDLGLCQNMASLVSQLVLLFLSKQLTFYRSGVTICLVYMMFLCIIFLAIPINKFASWHIFLLQIVNGLATGVAQTLMGSLGGLYGAAGRVGGILFAGNGLGALAPPAVQIILTFAHGVKMFTKEELANHNRETALVVFSIGAVGSFAGIVAINMLASKTNNYKVLTRPKMMEANEDFMTIGSKREIATERWAKQQVVVSEFFIVFVRAVWLYILAVAPYVTNTIVGSDSENFWNTNIATLLIVIAAFGDFVGRAVANKPEWISLRVRGVLIPANLLRLSFVAIVIAYIKSAKLRDAIGEANVFITIVFFFMSATHGYLVVCLQTTAQVVCGFYPGQDSCPIISQFSWLASQIGLVIGIAFSFIPIGSKNA